MHVPRPRVPGELAFVLVLLLFAITALWQSYRIAGLSSWSSSGAVPMLAALVLVVSALKILFDTVRHSPPDLAGETLPRAFVRALLPRAVVGFTAIIALYMIALEPLGFIVSSFVFLVAGMRLLGSRRHGFNFLIAAVSLAAVYVIFQTAFSVVLPEGVLRGVL